MNDQEKIETLNNSHSGDGGSIKIHAPATIANLVCGFDILGMALNHPQDEMELKLTDEPGIRIKHIDGYDLPTEPDRKSVV